VAATLALVKECLDGAGVKNARFPARAINRNPYRLETHLDRLTRSVGISVTISPKTICASKVAPHK
jgi:hypothetical protein